MEQKKRIEYIDALRGFTMILVVWWHVEFFSFEFTGASYIVQILQSFRMPLFFFVSGFIAYKENLIWSLGTFTKLASKKITAQLIPTLILGILYTYTMLQGENALTFLKNGDKFGYWFTISLLEMFIIYYSICYIASKIHMLNLKKLVMGGVIIVSLTLSTIILIFKDTAIYNTIGAYIGIGRTGIYFPYFAIGIIASIYKTKFNQLLDNISFITIAILLFIGFILFRDFYTCNPNIPILSQLPINSLLNYACGFSGIIIVFNFFRKYQESFTQATKIGKVLQYIGRRTLDIYLLHYFLLPDLGYIGKYFGSSSTIIGVFAGITISLMIISVCLVISNTIRLSPILAHYLFGARKQ